MDYSRYGDDVTQVADRIVPIITKYNHNHGEGGRFTSGPGDWSTGLEATHAIEARHPGVEIWLSDPSPLEYHSAKISSLSMFRVDKDKRGHGLAEAAMQDATAWADAHGVMLTASPTSEFGSSKTRLTAWNKRHGFVENKGRNKDLQLNETMYRHPQIRKYNHNHDSQGQFSTGAGGGGVIKVQLSANRPTDMTPAARGRIDEGLTAIGAVIKRTPNIKNLTIHVQSPKDMPYPDLLGYYSPTAGGKLVISNKTDSATLVHEYAHMLDYEQLGPRGAGSNSGRMFLRHVPGGDNAPITAVGKAVMASPEYSKGFGAKTDYLRTYLGGNQEIFARAFTQYIANKSGNKALLKAVQKDSTQWSPENFKPISDAMDSYLQSEGLV